MAITLENIPDIPEEGFLELKISYVLPTIKIDLQERKEIEIQDIEEKTFFLLEKSTYGDEPSIKVYGKRVNLSYGEEMLLPLKNIIRVRRARVEE